MHGVGPFSPVQYQRTEPKEEKKESIITKVREPLLGWAGLAWPGLAWPGLAWAGLGWPGLAWAGLG